MRIAIFGIGYVGATNAACLAKLGHSVVGVDVNDAKVAILAQGRSPILEPQVPELLAESFAAGRVHATTSTAEALADADLAMVCVGTPSQPNGALEAKYLRRVSEQIAAERKRLGRVIPVFVRSTCLPTVHRELMEILRADIGEGQPIAYCVHPEFLREGQAVADFFEPPKIVYGPSDAAARAVIDRLYPGVSAPTEIMDPAAAALVKYADNCFHAVKVTFGNEIGLLSASFGVDAREVMRVFCLDTKLNISARYLTPGLPFGGSCLPKDLRAVNAWSQEHRLPLAMLDQVMTSNQRQIEAIVGRVLSCKPRTLAMLGVTFKDDTDDLRESPMLSMFETLRRHGIEVKVFDPLVDKKGLVAPLFVDLANSLSDDVAGMVAHSDAVIVARRKLGVDLAELKYGAQTTVFDLVGANLPQGSHKVVGLYW